jgi:hypothetical protein
VVHALARALYVATAVIFVLTVAVFVHASAVLGRTAPWPPMSWFVLLPPLAAAITLSLSARAIASTPASRLGWVRENPDPQG